LLENVGLIVFDEGHMIGLNTRELRYEMLVQRLLRRPDARSRRLLCLSAMLPTGKDLSDFVDWISGGEQTEAMESSWRPTRQRFGIITREGDNYRLDMRVDSERPFVRAYVHSREATGRRKLPFPKDDLELVVASAWRLREDDHSVLIYCPERRGVEAVGKRILKLVEQGLISAQSTASERFQEAFRVGAEWLGVDHVVLQCLKLGVGLHHGGLPRPFMQILETLISEKALKIIISSPTLAQGVNVTVSTIVFQSLYRGGELIELDEFLNVCGRAGRPFVDIDGQVIFTVNATGQPGRSRRWAWDQFSATANQRSLTSGLVALVRNLIKKLSLGKASKWEATEYIVGMSLLYKNEAGDENDVEGDLRKLDEAILSLLGEGSDCDSSDIAETLDNILTGSLWSRQLARIDDAKRSIYQAVLAGRANVVGAGIRWTQFRRVKADPPPSRAGAPEMAEPP
jgi:replicative superfamily II helicase